MKPNRNKKTRGSSKPDQEKSSGKRAAATRRRKEREDLIRQHLSEPENISAELKQSAHGERLQKVLAAAGVGSRRACEELIEAGRVKVNGKVVMELPIWVDTNMDRLMVDGRELQFSKSKTYLMVYKPRGVVCTNDDPEERKKIIDLVPHRDRMFCVGRLDMDSNGLVLLTNDGDLANKLTHPRYEIPKTYLVTVKGSVQQESLDRLKAGLWLADKTGKSFRVQVSDIRLLSRDRDRSRLQVTLREGKNREIRRMLERIGHPVHRLTRVAIGPLRLKGLSPGEWRALTRTEVNGLKKTARISTKRERDKRTGETSDTPKT